MLSSDVSRYFEMYKVHSQICQESCQMYDMLTQHAVSDFAITKEFTC